MLARYRRAAWSAFSLALCACACAWAADDTVPASESASAAATEYLIDFDIPALPLATSLERFALVSGRPALFDSALVENRSAAPVRGFYTLAQALRRMLIGTGLMVEEVRNGPVTALVIKPASAQARASDAATQAAAQERLLSYDGLLQQTIWAALCKDPRTASQHYQSLLRFRINPAGRIEGLQLLGSTGERKRDAALLENLRELRLGVPPPVELSQPVTLLILPQQAGAPGCQLGEEAHVR